MSNSVISLTYIHYLRVDQSDYDKQTVIVVVYATVSSVPGIVVPVIFSMCV
uniref:Uncharacterized protein n=1 Tax=Arion vulgaris TaxID=1028688 RepID=A0A0B7A0P9_9EUPU